MQQLDKNNKELTLRLSSVVSNNSDGVELLISLYNYQGILAGDKLFFGNREEDIDNFTQLKPYTYSTDDELRKHLQKLLDNANKYGYGFYFSISIYNKSDFYDSAPVKRRIEFVSERTRLVAVDIDGGDYTKSSFRPLYTWESSTGSMQAIYDIGPSENREEYRKKQLQLTAELNDKCGIDCGDPCRFVRFIGSHNHKPKRVQANGGIAPQVGNGKFRDLTELDLGEVDFEVTKVEPLKNISKFKGWSLDTFFKRTELENYSEQITKTIDKLSTEYKENPKDRSKYLFRLVAELLKYGVEQENILQLILGTPNKFKYATDKWKTKDSLANQINHCVYNALNNPDKKKRVIKGFNLLEIGEKRKLKEGEYNSMDLTKRANIKDKYIRKDKMLMVKTLDALKIDYDVIYYERKPPEYKIKETTENIKKFCGFYDILLYSDVLLKQPYIVYGDNKPKVIQSGDSWRLRSHFIEDFNFNISNNNLYGILMEILCHNQVNKVLDFIRDCCYPLYKEQPEDYIKKFVDMKYVFKDDSCYNEYLEFFHKFFLQAIYLLNNEGGTPTQFILILQGGGGKGKSFSIDMMVPTAIKEYYSDSAVLNYNNKDSIIQITSGFLREAAEIEDWFKYNTNGEVKKFISGMQDTFRIPYDKNAESHPRRTSYIGTVNESKFLTDETGTRRFLTVELKDVHQYKHLEKCEEIKLFNDLSMKMWGQVYEEYLKSDGIKDCLLSEEAKKVQTIKNNLIMVDANGVEEFFKDRISTGHKGYGITKEDLWEEYQKYCPRFGYSTIKGGKARFNERLVNLFKLESTNKNLRNDLYGGKKLGRKQYWNGLRLIENLDK